MKKLGIAFICKDDKKDLILARRQALSSIVRTLFACGALKYTERSVSKNESCEKKVSLTIDIADDCVVPDCKDSMGRDVIPKDVTKEFNRLFPNLCI